MLLKIRRLASIAIDYFLLAFLTNTLSIVFEKSNISSIAYYILYGLAFILLVFIIVFKDSILKNRSIGKFLMGLQIYDANGEILNDKEKLAWRTVANILFLPLNFFTILYNNKSYADRIYKTCVGPSKKNKD